MIRSKVNGLVINEVPYAGVVVDLEKGAFAERVSNGKAVSTSNKGVKLDKKDKPPKEPKALEPQEETPPPAEEIAAQVVEEL